MREITIVRKTHAILVENYVDDGLIKINERTACGRPLREGRDATIEIQYVDCVTCLAWVNNPMNHGLPRRNR